jgi:cell division protein ZapA (FtsZ GTPase activity inhibitor)
MQGGNMDKKETKKKIKNAKLELTKLVEALNENGADVSSLTQVIIAAANSLHDLQAYLNSFSDTDEQKFLEKSARRMRKKKREEAKAKKQ